MLNITNEQKELFKKDSLHKNLVIPFTDSDLVINNSNIISESMILTETLCNEEQIKFGLINSSQFEVTVAEIDSDVKGKEIKPYLAISDLEIPLGVFLIKEVQKLQDKPYKKLVAMDRVSKLDVSVKDWYESLEFPISVKNFRDGLFNSLGMEQEEVTLSVDELMIEDIIEEVNGRQIMQQICELEGCFGRFNRYGKFEYLKLSTSDESYSLNHTPSIFRSNPVIDDYDTKPIDGVRFYGTDGEFSQFGGSENIYVVEDNFLINNRSSEELQVLANKFLAKVGNTVYRPFSVSMMGQPYLELGDKVSYDGYVDNIVSYVFKRTMSGTQALKDAIDTKGQEYLDIDTNSIVSQLLKLNRNDKQMKIDISATKQGLSIKVGRDEVISAINASPEEVQIEAKNINLNGAVTANDYFKINENGSMETSYGIFNGDIIGNADFALQKYNEEIKKTERVEIKKDSVSFYDTDSELRIIDGRDHLYKYYPNGQLKSDEFYVHEGESYYSYDRLVYSRENMFVTLNYEEDGSRGLEENAIDQEMLTGDQIDEYFGKLNDVGMELKSAYKSDGLYGAAITDNLTSDSLKSALSANQGRVLDEKISSQSSALNSRIDSVNSSLSKVKYAYTLAELGNYVADTTSLSYLIGNNLIPDNSMLVHWCNAYSAIGREVRSWVGETEYGYVYVTRTGDYTSIRFESYKNNRVWVRSWTRINNVGWSAIQEVPMDLSLVNQKISSTPWFDAGRQLTNIIGNADNNYIYFKKSDGTICYVPCYKL